MSATVIPFPTAAEVLRLARGPASANTIAMPDVTGLVSFGPSTGGIYWRGPSIVEWCILISAVPYRWADGTLYKDVGLDGVLKVAAEVQRRRPGHFEIREWPLVDNRGRAA